MADIGLSFSVENGISLDDEVGIFTGIVDPSVTGENAPLGSLFIRQNGSLYQKIGAGLTDWMRFTQGLGEAVKISATDSTAGYLTQKLLVGSNLTKSVSNSGANETLTIDLTSVGSPGTYRSVTVDAYGRVTAGTNPTTLLGYGITDAQPLAANLTSISALTGTGFYVRTGTTTAATRQIVGTNNQITVSNANGSSGDPTLTLSSTILFPGTTGIRPPSGTTAQRVNTASYLRYNTSTNRMEYYNGTTWIELVASTGGTITSISAVAPSSGLTISGSPITTSGTLTFALANDLAAIEALGSTGFAVRTANDSWANRSLLGATDRITVTNGDAVLSDPVIDIASTYIGQSSISTVGTITTGTWAGSVIGTAFGGTGRSTIGSANQFLLVNTVGSGLEYKDVIAGAGISLTYNPLNVVLTNTGVRTITGTANQVMASSTTGEVILTLPQNIAPASSPSFAQITVGADPASPLQVATKQYVDSKVQGVVYKSPVKAATTSNVTLSGLGQVIDGYTTLDGDRVLVKNQTISNENGVYVVSSGSWVRSDDLNSWTELYAASVFVEEGTVNANSSWYCTVPQSGNVTVDPITWVLFFKSGTLTAGTGLSKIGNVLSIANVGSAGTYNQVTTNAQGQVVSGALVPYLTGNQLITLQGDITGSGSTLINATLSNTGVTAGTYTSVTVNSKGRVTSASTPTTLAGYSITDAQPLNPYLTSVSGLSSNGIVVKNGNSAITRSVAAGSTRVSVINPDGIAGNPTIDVVEANLSLNNIGGTLSPSKGGTGLSSLGAANSFLGVNSSGTGAEYKVLSGSGITITHSAGGINFATVNNGTVTSVAVSGSTGLSVSGSPITSSGTIALTLGSELQGLSQISSNGFVTRTAAGTYASRSVVSGNGTLTVTNSLGTSGNLGLDLTTVGTAGTYRSVTTDVYGRVTAGTNPTTLSGFGITDAINISEKGVANGVATLDAAGKIPVAQLPAIAINETFVVASEAAMLSLTAQTGDMAVRTDINRTFVLSTSPSTSLANWVQLADGPSGTVTSVSVTAPAAGLTITGSPITSSGTFAFALANDLAAIENLSSVGLAVRSAGDTWATRTLVAGAGIAITNANGVGGDITISSTAVGTVTSVGVTASGPLTVTGSPITSSGTINLGFANQSANRVFAGPSTGAAAQPSFRTLGLATNDINDVTITSAVANQVLAYNGTRWVNTGAVGANASGLIGVGQIGSAAWTAVSGSLYRADFAHNLGTTNVVITLFDTSNNSVVTADSIVLTDANTVRVTVVGNTRTLKVVVVANGQSIVAGGSTPSSVIVAKDGVNVATATKVNFTGQAVTVTDAGSGTANVSIGSRFSYFANSLDSPVNADWAVNVLAPTITDPSFNSLSVRSFSNATEQGVGMMLSIPPGATQMTMKIRGRAQTAQAAAQNVQFRLYSRLVPNNSAMPSWSAAYELVTNSVPANANFQYFTQTIPLSTLGLTADRLYTFEITRRITGVTSPNLATPFLVAEITVEFS